MCGCGRTSIPAPGAKSAGPIWSKKINGPTILVGNPGRSRRTSNPPRSFARGFRINAIVAVIDYDLGWQWPESTSRRENEIERLASVFSIHQKIRVQCKHQVFFKKLGHAHDAGIGKRDRLVAVLAMQRAQGGEMFPNLECDAHSAIDDQAEKRVLRLRLACEEEHRFRQHRFT